MTQKFDPEGTFVWSSTLAFFARGAIANQMSVDKDNNLYISGNVGTDQSGVQMMVVKYKDAVCAPLETDDFKQCDLPWNDDIYDSTMLKMCRKGCAVTALAALNNFYRDSFQLAIASTTPGELNQKLIGLGALGYDLVQHTVKWEAISLLTSGLIIRGDKITQNPLEDTLDYNLNSPWSRDELIAFATQDIEAGRLVIVRTVSPSGNTHFVLATGACGDKFQIVDPRFPRIEIDPKDPATPITGIRRYKNKQ